MINPEERKWEWFVGIVLGLGECAFQMSHGEIRRITKLIPQDNGSLGLIKTAIGGVLKGFEQIPADGLLPLAIQAKDDFASSLDKFWGSVILQPANGRLPKDWKLEK